MSGVAPEVTKPQNPRAAWKEQNRTRSWFEPSTAAPASPSPTAHSSGGSLRGAPPALAVQNPANSVSHGNLRTMWSENSLTINPTSTSAPALQLPSPKKWQENQLGSHTFHFTSFSSGSTPPRPSSPKRRPTFPLPSPPPTITTSSSSSNPNLAPSPTNVPLMNGFEDVFVTANGIFNRSMSKLSVAKDLPRFCPNIRIYKNHEVIHTPGNEDGVASHIKDIKNFLLTLLAYLDPPELLQAFEENFGKYVKEEFDIAQRLEAFFQSGVLPAECNTIAALRCIHQEIIFPVVMSLRQSVYEMFPYKDVKGSWSIYVVLVEAKGGVGGVGKGIGEVRVVHTKKEQSHDPSPSAHFEFEWAMVLTLALPFYDEADPESPTAEEIAKINLNNALSNSGNVNKSELMLQSVDFWVINYWTNEGFDKNTKPLLLKVLQKFFHPSTGTMCLWSKQDIFNINCARDFPRLAVKTTVYDDDKQIVLFSPAAESDTEPALSVLLLLIDKLNPEYMNVIKKAYDTHVERGGDKLEFSQKFANFMNSLGSDKVVPADCLLVKVLKCITNEIIYPSAMMLREQIYGDFPYKDVRNSRKVMINISEQKQRIKVSHLKAEQTTDGSVEFEWQVTFTISKTGSNSLFGLIWYLKQGMYSSVKTRLKIDRYVLSEDISNSLKIRFRELVHSLVAGRAEKQGVPVPALDFLQCMLSSVESLGDTIPIRLPKVAKMVPLNLALQYLSNALAKVPFELPPVVVPKNRTDSLDPSFSKRKDDGGWK